MSLNPLPRRRPKGKFGSPIRVLPMPPTNTATPVLAYVADPKADLVLKSSDGTSFPVRRVFLQTSSEVFEDMFASFSDDETKKDDSSGLPVVKLEETGADLDLFLRFVVRNQDRSGADGGPILLEQIKSLIHISDKYGAKALVDQQDVLLRLAVAKDPPGLFGFAMSHGLIETARAALSLFQKTYEISSKEVYGHQGHYYGAHRVVTRDKPFLLMDADRSDLARIPFEIMFELQRAQERVLLGQSYWAQEAQTIKLT